MERQVFILGEAASRLSDAARALAPDIPWRGLIGMRNVLAHGYWKIDDETLWDVAVNRVPELLEQVRRLRAAL